MQEVQEMQVQEVQVQEVQVQEVQVQEVQEPVWGRRCVCSMVCARAVDRLMAAGRLM